MISIPRSVCPPCVIPNEKVVLTPIPPIDSCPPCEPEDDAVVLESIPASVCPCPPLPDPIVVPLSRKIKVTKIELCYKEFVLAVSTTKHCDTGPKCRPGV